MNAHSLSLASIARALGGKINGHGVLAPGPGHSRDDASLSVTLGGPDGFVVHSFADDDPLACKDYVRSKLGLPGWQPAESADSPEAIIARMGDMAAKARAEPVAGPRVVAEYVYRLADGTPYLRVQRTRDKAFWQSHWTGSAWAKGKPQGPKVPYRLPEMRAAVHDTVLVVEGEKDADALAAAGFVATTAPEGAGKWTPDLNEHFREKTVYILADNDEAGAKHARQVADHLHGVAREVRVIDLPGLPPKGDASDWLEAGGNPGTLIDLCQAVPVYRPGATGDPAPGDKPRLSAFSADDLNSMRFPEMRFVVPGFLVEGCTILAGAPKVGKSWLCLDIAIAVATGGTCLGGIECEQGDVLYLALEDNQRRLQSRMQKLMPLSFDGWPKALHFSTECPREAQGGADAIRDWITRAGNPRLVIVDVLQMFRSPRGDKQGLYEADYLAVKALQHLASETGVAIVIVHHVRKGGSDLDPFEEVSGTFGIMGASDAGLVLRRDGQGFTLYTRGRDIEEAETAVELNRDTCKWRALGAASEVRRSDVRTKILDALRASESPMTPAEVAAATGIEPNTVRQRLFGMKAKGEVILNGARYAPGITSSPPHTPHNGRNGHNAEDYQTAKDGGDNDPRF